MTKEAKSKLYTRIGNTLILIGILGFIYAVIGLIMLWLSPDYELLKTAYV